MSYEHERINRALDLAARCGSIDGAHHKMWVIDQMVRELTGCPIVERTAVDTNGKTYTYKSLGESRLYKQFVEEFCAGEDGPNTYSWDEGIAP